MPNISIQTPNVTKTYSLDAGQVQQLLAYATDTMENGQAATTAEKEAWIARQFMVLMRQAVWKHEDLKQKRDLTPPTAIPVTEV